MGINQKTVLTAGHHRVVVRLAETAARKLYGRLCFTHDTVHVHLRCARCGRDHGDRLDFKDWGATVRVTGSSPLGKLPFGCTLELRAESL